MTKKEEKLRQALADYIKSEGCSCCRNEPEHTEAKERLGKLLNVPKYDDDSGYNFFKFASK